ncbi:MAG TPA: hypothetical protein ACFYD7_00050 [Candidatus Wujingus californicus]|uniref:hypothetical protein n=1 Tax=Candidatus Wujingus californicus TaxID=3367618 RepID=UPI001DF2CF74|nr:hypothetical protein [Planctomycetota bacterium]MDO8130569.1 hypothetical protein [Candidatus Brocadiales bacterium]
MGFSLGEHLTSLSLAPGEEVTIEQKTYTKVEQSFEETKDDEVTKDQELSSTYTNELSESLDWQTSLSKKSTNTSGAKVSGSYEGIGVEASTQTANDLNDGDTRTARDSLKLSETNTRKVASKQRQQHKIVMRLSQESRFETGSKRVIKNTNSLAPIDLVYFKILQRLQVSQERYGIRLCWAPTVADPAGRLFTEIEQRRQEFMAVATAIDVGPAPVQPTPPSTHPAITQAVVKIADKFDPVWGGQSADYVIEIPAPANYVWDSVPVTLTFGFTASRPAGGRILTTVATQTGVQVIVHVGIEDCRNPVKPQWWQAVGTATITLTANFLPTPDTAADVAYTAALAQYRQAFADWKAKRDAALAEATARAETQWQQIRANLIARANIVQEVVGALIEQAFPRSVRDEPWELDFWERIFDFDNVSVRFYPAWWCGHDLRDPDTSATSFMNASWAKVYVPIRPGAEDIALRWLLVRSLTSTNSPLLEALIKQIVADLKAYRLANFGSEDEMYVTPQQDEDCPTLTRPYKCLGKWYEHIPTDGTHLEVLQATTSGADDDLTRRLQLQNDLQQENVNMSAKDVAIKDVVAGSTLNGLTSHVEISVPKAREE